MYRSRAFALRWIGASSTLNAAPDAAPRATRLRLSRVPEIWFAIAALPVVAGVVLSLVHLKATWDDAAITLAFARTWAQTGHIALTPVSVTVEGFSSVLWFLLLSVPYFFTHNPTAGLVWMKLLSAAFLLLSLPQVYSIGKRQLKNSYAAAGCALLYAFCITPLREAQNGMEMNLATFLLLLLFRVFTEDVKHRTLWASILTCLLLLARFESPFVLALLCCGLFADRAARPYLLRVSVIAVCAFAAIELWRYHTFGEWMPNTVYAKRFLPYSRWSVSAKFGLPRVTAMLEVVTVVFVPMIAAVAASFFQDSRRPIRLMPPVWVLALGCFLFGAIFGPNPGGSPGRMVAPMLPFLLIALVGIFFNCIPRPQAANLLLLLIVVAQAFYVTLQQSSLAYGNATIAFVENIGLAADSIRVAQHREMITAMISDVGGSALCCERLRIEDSGLLTNPVLGRTGWKDFAAYFRSVNPDVVEAHDPWAELAGIRTLLGDYSPVMSHGVLVYVRNYASAGNDPTAKIQK